MYILVAVSVVTDIHTQTHTHTHIHTHTHTNSEQKFNTLNSQTSQLIMVLHPIKLARDPSTVYD